MTTLLPASFDLEEPVGGRDSFDSIAQVSAHRKLTLGESVRLLACMGGAFVLTLGIGLAGLGIIVTGGF